MTFDSSVAKRKTFNRLTVKLQTIFSQLVFAIFAPYFIFPFLFSFCFLQRKKNSFQNLFNPNRYKETRKSLRLSPYYTEIRGKDFGGFWEIFSLANLFFFFFLCQLEEKKMTRGEVSNSSSGNQNVSNNNETNVILNVYDLTPINNYSHWVGFGIFHSGIEGKKGIFLERNLECNNVHGKEYGFGAHDFPISGVFEVEPKSCPGFNYRCSISLGQINMPSSEFREFIESVASEYHGDTYHLISKNCNHFTDDMAHRLTGRHIPGWVNRLARLGSLFSCLLPESLQVTAVKQMPEYHEMDGTESLSTTTPHDSTELDDTDQEKHLLSPKDENLDIAFVKEAQK
ncbi:deSI-like protein At4g17486 isoform X2 [Durio zibethinus]|uniref:DeSI-like protein At4g17486 isoform X2 n=1 Tax=Durio zibethinus TaxID=66656 RepID=A0A6P5ZB80_DURZI|nr:deSI-like protein At4g17486 isoform X2 [Durio zibethinus]